MKKDRLRHHFLEYFVLVPTPLPISMSNREKVLPRATEINDGARAFSDCTVHQPGGGEKRIGGIRFARAVEGSNELHHMGNSKLTMSATPGSTAYEK